MAAKRMRRAGFPQQYRQREGFHEKLGRSRDAHSQEASQFTRGGFQGVGMKLALKPAFAPCAAIGCAGRIMLF